MQRSPSERRLRASHASLIHSQHVSGDKAGHYAHSVTKLSFMATRKDWEWKHREKVKIKHYDT